MTTPSPQSVAAFESRFIASMSNAAEQASVAIVERHAPWPSWLDTYLTGRQDVLVVLQLPGESRGALARRAAARAARLQSPIQQVVWVAAGDPSASPRILTALGECFEAECSAGRVIVATGESLIHPVASRHGDVVLVLSPGQLSELHAEVA